jgi:hypothetical protein
VKAAAAGMGILTQCLQDQEKELSEPAIKKVLVKKDVVAQRRPIDTPTKAPTLPKSVARALSEDKECSICVELVTDE